MTLHFERFPELNLNGERLIWDTRQKSTGQRERVFVNPQTLELTSRANAQFVDAEAYPNLLGEMAAESLGHPSRKLKVLAVTGTNGKTSCVHMAASLLRARGHRVCEIGTLGIRFEGELLETGFTTPEAPALQFLFYNLLMNKCTHVVMEASSHAMALGRVAGIDFDSCLFTNLTQDHLDFHGDLASYAEAKSKLFLECLPLKSSLKQKSAVIHCKDSLGAELLLKLRAAKHPKVSVVEFAVGVSHALEKHNIRGTSFKMLDTSEHFESALVGTFNADNLVGALLWIRSVEGADSKTDVDVIRNLEPVAGRLERVTPKSLVFVDYAHTPDALFKTLQVLSETKEPDAKLWVVFGCGGDRDALKRPAMGQIAAEWADQVILTSDNPREESPSKIIDDIFAGVPAGRRERVRIQSDRRLAIGLALRSMAGSDVCVIAGKGHENYQVVGKSRIPFSDKTVCLEFLTQT